VELHTSVREGSVGAEIRVQGQQAHSLLSAGLPSLERALTDRNLRVENISVFHDQSRGSTNDGQRQGSQSESHPPRQQFLPWDESSQTRREKSEANVAESSINTAAGLSVRA